MESSRESTVNGNTTDGKKNINRKKTQKATLSGGIQGKYDGRQARVYLKRPKGLKLLWLCFPPHFFFQLKLLVVGQPLKSLAIDVLTWLNKTSPSFRSGGEVRNGRGDAENGAEMGKRQRWR